MPEGTWRELARGVLARRHPELDLTTGLVLGAEGCLVIDTRGDAAQGGELAAAVRDRTPLPWTVVLTHAHFDHAYGTSAFLPADVLAHPGCRDELARVTEPPPGTGIVLPHRLVRDRAVLDLGGRRVELHHFGPAHTGHDLVVHVPDAGVVFAGDLVEHGPAGFTAESFGQDSALDGWPGVLDALLDLDAHMIVPGHGDPVGRSFVAGQRRKLAELVHALGASSETAVLTRSPYPEDVTRAALSAWYRAGGAAATTG
jgi:glyoxylase-like metal-dependent hydrolase (beta-lactamase superfamily II)